MNSRTCDYVASKSHPESWHGTESSTFHLDRPFVLGGSKSRSGIARTPRLTETTAVTTATTSTVSFTPIRQTRPRMSMSVRPYWTRSKTPVTSHGVIDQSIGANSSGQRSAPLICLMKRSQLRSSRRQI